MEMSPTSSPDPKTAIMEQVRQDSAVSNARQLIEVGERPIPPFIETKSNFPLTLFGFFLKKEHQRELLRTLHL